MTDPSNPKTWWRMLVDAVIGMRHRSTEAATQYLRFVERHRGREVALQARARLKELATSPGWADVEQWPARGYKPHAPRVEPESPATKKRGRR